MPAEEAVIDTQNAADTTVDNAATAIATQDTAVQDTQQTDDVQGDDRFTPKWIKDLQDTEIRRQARNNFHELRNARELTKDFDVKATRAWLDENGGRDGIEQSRADLQAKAAQWDAVQEKVSKGETDLWDSLSQDNPQGAAALMRDGIDRLSKLDPDGYNSALAGIFSATIKQSEIPAQLSRMIWSADLLGDVIRSSDLANNPQVVRAYNELYGGLDGINKWQAQFGQVQTGQQQTKTPAQQSSGQQAWEREKADFEQKQFTDNYTADVNKWRGDEVLKELAPFIERRKDDVDAKDIAVQGVISRVKQRMAGDKDFQGKLMALESRRDKAGALRLIQSREKSAIQEIAQQVGRSVYGNPKAKEEPKQDAQQAGQKRVAQTVKPADAFDRIWAS